MLDLFVANDRVEETVRDLSLFRQYFLADRVQGLLDEHRVLHHVLGGATTLVADLDQALLNQDLELGDLVWDFVPPPAQVVRATLPSLLLHLQGPGHDLTDLRVGRQQPEHLLALVLRLH